MKCNLYPLFGFCRNLHLVFEGKPHIILAVDCHEIHHGVPCCPVKIIHLLRQAPQYLHEALHHFSLCPFLRDGCPHFLQPRFRHLKPLHQGIIPFGIFAPVLCDAGILPDTFLYQFCRHCTDSRSAA